MNRWHKEIHKEHWLNVIKQHIDKIQNCNLEEESPYNIELDLSDTELHPYALWQLLEELGWKRDRQDDNGWQMDFWIYFKKDGFRNIVITGCGMTFELKLRGVEE